jgi:predicted choloylglycine hydrolase
MLDYLWGLLDGVNDSGLAVSLTFGERPQVGQGLGVPMVIRYVLEVCGTAAEAVQSSAGSQS